MAETKITQSEVQPVTWYNGVLGTGWTTFDTGVIPQPDASADSWRYIRYNKDAMGYVHLQGMAVNNGGTNNNSTTRPVIVTLPAGFRPGHTITLSVMMNDLTARIDIRVNGEVRLATGSSLANGGWISLSNIHFLGEQ